MKCTGKIAAILSSADCIDANDRDVCAYGLEILFMTVLEVASIILILFMKDYIAVLIQYPE
mgnify:CR=1 FL=1